MMRLSFVYMTISFRIFDSLLVKILLSDYSSELAPAVFACFRSFESSNSNLDVISILDYKDYGNPLRITCLCDIFFIYLHQRTSAILHDLPKDILVLTKGWIIYVSIQTNTISIITTSPTQSLLSLGFQPLQKDLPKYFINHTLV